MSKPPHQMKSDDVSIIERECSSTKSVDYLHEISIHPYYLYQANAFTIY